MSEEETRVASPFAAMATAWTSFAENAVKGATAANRAAFAAFAPGVESSSMDTEETTASDEEEIVEASVPSVVYEHADWTFERTVEHAEELTSRAGWQELSAVKAGRVYAMDGHHYVNRPGPRLVETLEFLAGLVQPEVFDAPPGEAVSQLAQKRSA